jgi:hypothetical protein
MPSYAALKLLIKDNIFAVAMFAILYSRGYKQKYVMAAHLSTFFAARTLSSSTETSFWVPTFGLALAASTILADVWIASTLFCNPLQGVQCCARGQSVPPFAFGLELCSKGQESWYSVLPTIYAAVILLGANNLAGLIDLISSQRPQASLVAVFEIIYALLKVWVLYWTGAAYSYTFTSVTWLSAGLAIAGMATSFWHRAISLICFAGCAAIDALFFAGMLGTWGSLPVSHTQTTAAGRRLLGAGIFSTGIEQLVGSDGVPPPPGPPLPPGGLMAASPVPQPNYVLYYLDGVFVVCGLISVFSILAASSRPDTYRGPFPPHKPEDPETEVPDQPRTTIFNALRRRVAVPPAPTKTVGPTPSAPAKSDSKVANIPL